MTKFKIFIFFILFFIYVSSLKCNGECFYVGEKDDEKLFNCAKKLYIHPDVLDQYESYDDVLKEKNMTRQSNIISYLSSFR